MENLAPAGNREALERAEAAGAAVERFDLFRLEKYTGCISCFGCKKKANNQALSHNRSLFNSCYASFIERSLLIPFSSIVIP